MHIWVDADACPAVIKDILFRAAQRWQMPLTLVANQALYTPPSPLIRAVQVPRGFDVADAHIYRLPLTVISGDGQEITDVDEEHHLRLVEWMKYLAYGKNDADTFNPRGSAEAEQRFRAYCAQVKAEWERYKTKPVRVVSYGGL